MDSESASDARERFGEIASQYEQGASRKWEFTQILHLLTSVSLLPPFHLRLDVPPMYLLSINLHSYATGKRYANRNLAFGPGHAYGPSVVAKVSDFSYVDRSLPKVQIDLASGLCVDILKGSMPLSS